MANIKFDARHGLTVGNGSVTVVNSDGTIQSGITGGVTGDILYQSSAGVTAKLSDVATGNALLSGGVGSAPSYGKVGLTTHVSGILPVANGGSGVGTSTGNAGNLVLSEAPTLTGTNTTSALTLTGGTLTGTSQPVINATQTWNNSGTAFSGIRLDITATGASSTSKPIHVTVGSNEFGVDINGSVVQRLATPNIARDIVGVSGSRHVREYQDLTDDGVQGMLGSPGVSTHSFEWGFTWNAKWDTGSSLYIKDRNNAGDHALMFRISKKFNQEWWFSDGTTPGAISWVNRITFNLPSSTYTFDGTINTTNLNVSNIFTSGTTTTSDLVVNGNFTVNGTQTILNTTEWNVDDTNITLGAVATPTDTTANGGGITLKGTTDKTIAWNQGTTNWDISEHLNLAVTKAYKINGANVLTNTTLGDSVVNSSLTKVGTIGTGVWNASVISGEFGGTGVNNVGKTITLGGNLTTVGAYATTITSTNTTNVTLPTSGTLATLAGVETLTNKTITGTFTGNLTGNADTVTNGVYTSGSYADPTWITSLAKSKVGLGSVENTALSTWAGTTNITTLGTIATGTWNGTVIADGKIASALTGKTYNGITLTANGTGFSVAGGGTSKTLTVNNTLTIAGTDGTTITLPSTTGTVALNNQTMYIGTTAVNINRASGALALTGITSIDGTATYLSATQQTQLITGASLPMSMSADTSTRGSFVCRAAGSGDGNLAGMSFHNDAYALKLGVRADGVFGLGGWSRAAWSWYSDASGNMVAAGNVTAYSDPRLKENFTIISNPFGILDKLDGGTFTWKSGIPHTQVKAGKRDYGVLADQVDSVMPEIVSDSIDIDGVKYKTVSYEKLVPVLIEAIKELRGRISILEGQV